MHPAVKSTLPLLPFLAMLTAHTAHASVSGSEGPTPAWVMVDFVGLGGTATVIAIITGFIRPFVPQWNERLPNEELLRAFATIRERLAQHIVGAADLTAALDMIEALATRREMKAGWKALLRLVPVVVGGALGYFKVATPVGDSSHPWIFGGILAGLVASQWGHLLIDSLKERMFVRKQP